MLTVIFISLLLALIFLIVIESRYSIHIFNKKKLKYNIVISIEKIKYLLYKGDYDKLNSYIDTFFDKNFDDLESINIVLEILITEYEKTTMTIRSDASLDDNASNNIQETLSTIIKKLISKGMQINPTNILLNELTLQYFNISQDKNIEQFLTLYYKKSRTIFSGYIKHLVDQNKLLDAINIINTYDENEYLVNEDIKQWAEELKMDESYIVQKLEQDPDNIKIKKEYIVKYLLPQKKWIIAVQNILDIIEKQEIIDTELSDILIQTIKEDKTIYKKINQEKLLKTMERLYKVIDDPDIKKTYLMCLIYSENIDKFIDFIKNNESMIYNDEDIAQSFMSILENNLNLLQQINTDKIINFIISSLEKTYETIEKYLRILNYIYDNHILTIQKIIKIKTIIETNIKPDTTNIPEIQLYTKLLTESGENEKAYIFLDNTLSNKMYEHIDIFIHQYIEIINNIKTLEKTKINFNNVLKISEKAMQIIPNDNNITELYIDALQDTKDKNTLLDILSRYIDEKDTPSITVIEKYINIIIGDIDILDQINVNAITKIKTAYEQKPTNKSYLEILQYIYDYKEQNISNIYNKMYDVFQNDENVSLAQIQLFNTIFLQDNNIKNNAEFDKIIYILHKGIEKYPKEQNNILSKSKALHIFENVSNALDFLSNYITSDTGIILKKDIYKQTIEMMHELLNTTGVSENKFQEYTKTLQSIIGYVEKDDTLLKYYFEFLYKAKSYDSIEKYCENVFENKTQVSEDIYRLLVVLYLKISRHNAKAISDGNISNKNKRDSLLRKTISLIKPFVNDHIYDNEIVIEYSKLYEILGLYQDISNLLDRALSNKLSTDYISIIAYKINISKTIGEPIETQSKIAQDIIDKYPNKTDGYIILSKLLYDSFDNDKIEQANKLVLKAYEIDNTNIDVIKMYLKVLANNHELDNALSIAQDMIKKHPHDKSLLSIYLDIYKQHEILKTGNR